MRIVIEVVADDRDDALVLLREIVKKISKKREESGKEVNYCLGDYRITITDDET